MQQNTGSYNQNIELDEEVKINYRKIGLTLKSRKTLRLKVFLSVFLFFVLLTFVWPKKYTVDSDLYINKANNTNMIEINPYFIEDANSETSISALVGGGLSNELEIIKSPLVMDKVIKENNLVYMKKFGIIPNRKEGELISTKDFLKKNISIENKKGTNVIVITYKNKKPDIAYNVVSSIIKNYVELQKQLISERAKADKVILEAEYNKAKEKLNKKMKNISVMPQTALSGSGNIAAMSAFSHTARRAFSNIQGQFNAGEKARLEEQEDINNVAKLASKLQWAQLVEEISDSSKVIVLKEPKMLRDFENSSPKLLINIILGLIFGALSSLMTVIYVEEYDKKLTFSMIGEEFIYDIKKEANILKSILISNNNKKIGLVAFENIPNEIIELIKPFKNINLIKAEIDEEFKTKLGMVDKIILLEKIKQTDAELYKIIRNIITSQAKEIITEVLL